MNGTASDSLSVGGEFKQNGEAVGNLLYGYSLAADSKGVYLNAGLAGIEVLDGKTLMLSGDTTDVAGANEISLRLTGSGNIDVNATNSIIISNRSNTVSGMTSINSGTLLLTGNLPGDVTINPGTTLQIGENSASGEIGGSLIHNGTLLLRRTSGTFAANISGSGQVVLDHGSNVWLSGSNSHTGGVHFGGPAASFYIGSAHALGSGTLSIAPAAANTRIDVWMRPKEDANYTVDNPFVWTATNSRFIVRMRELTNEFAFGNAAESTFQGIFIAQRGTYQMNGDTAAILANAASIRFDKGSTIILGSSGTTILRDVQFSHTTPAASEAVVGNDPYAKVVLDADFSNPDSPEILSNFIITERLNVGTNTRIQLNHTGAIPVPEFTLPVFGSNILGVDDELNRDGFFTKLISIEPGAVLTGAANWLADMILLDAAGDRINASNNFDFMQDGDKIGTGYVNYFVGQQSDGLYMNYGFASLEIDGGKTLVLSGDTPEDNSFVAMLTGEGNVDVHATDSIKLGTYYGESTLTGTVTLHTGTLGFVTPGALSPASHLELAPDTGMDFNFTNQTVGTLNAPGSTTINLHAGRFTIAGSGTLDSTIFGTGIITVGANATLDVGGNNPDLDANWVAAPNARLTFHSAGAAGIGRVSGSNATSVITVQDVSGGEFNAEVTGGGAFTIASSTIAMTKGVTIGTFNVTASDVTVRHVNGLNASSIAAISDSIIRIDTDSHIRANTLRLNNSSIAFVPQANGSFGNLLVTSLESSGTTLVKMNADLTKAGAGDSIIITDNVVGAYVLDITNVAPGNRGDDGVALRVVRTPDESGLSRFTLKDGYLEAGVFTYELIQGDASNGAFVMNDPNSYYLAVAGASPLTRTAQAVLSTAAIAGAEWHYKLDSLSQRMGDLRREIEAAGKDRFYNTWLRSSSYKLKAGRELSGASFDENVYNFTFGADVGRRLGSGAATLMLGVYGDVGYVDRDFDNRSTGKTNSFGGGLYVTWLHQRGWYADLAFKADTQQNKFTAHALDNSEARGDYTGKTMGVSFEIGRKIKLGRVWWIEPGVQVASATFFKSNYETDNGIQVRIAENDAVQYRAQARIGRENINGRFQPYGRIAYARCRSGSLDVTADGLVLASDLDFDDTRYELGIGASFLFNQRSQLYMEYEYATASHYDRPWAVNIGFRRFW
ncbi:autotransporter outer membrane beta-barrel domain-containing protein [Ereboglobus sp. PH5-5]|uniref:autotransporter outer membrane beta-barrel domain-containing protein n=1 Tax=Ereboglobus sp. PH5-5 TaxID=2940529 RepID=UPI002406A93C|nr:autotransporter outer membrane beta-barrel domain-containing protein [Ereboglobus sp. PH5-5]